jgi:WD40 repeat protein
VSRALFCFVTGQYEHYDRLDNNPHRPLLASGYALATERVRFNTRYAAKMSKHCPVLGAALRGTDQTAKTARWSDEEWEVVVIGLIQEQKWRALWQLSVHAPLPMAIHALTAMEKAGWAPEGDERTLWEEIIRIIPDRWTCPVPENLLVRAHLTTERQPQRLAISGDGSLLAAGCSDGTICLWNTRNAMLVFQIYPGPGSISGLAISPDTTRLIFKETSGTLQCRDTVEGTLQWSVGTIGTPVPFSCSYDGKKVMIPGDEGQIHIVNITDGKTQLISGGDKASVTCCSQSHDNQFCAVGHADGSVGCWDLKGKHYLRTLEGLGDPVSSISFSEGGDECLVIYQRNLPARWKISTGKRSRVYTGNAGLLRCCAITNDGGSFAIAGDDRMLRLWQAGKTDPLAVIHLYNRPLSACAASPDGRLLIAGCIDGTLRIYSLSGGEILREWKAHQQAITSIVLSAGAEIVATSSRDGTLKIWNPTSGELIRTLHHPAGGVTGMAATPDVSKIYAGYSDGTVRQIPCNTGTSDRTLDMYTSNVRAIAINPEGTMIACAGGDSNLRLWNVETGGLVTGIEGLTTTQQRLAFSPDGKRLISGGWDGIVRLWEIPGGKLARTLKGHSSTITALAIAPEHFLLATGSNDRKVRLWTLNDSQCISVREDSRSEVSALAFSPDGSLLAYGGTDAMIYFCYLPEGIPAPAIPSLPGKITSLAFASEGRILVAGLDTGSVLVYSCAGRNLLKSIPAHNAEVTGIIVLPGGESILTSGLDGQVRQWNLPWTRHLSGTVPEDIQLVAGYERTSRANDRAQWTFLHHMLKARFISTIEFCTTPDEERRYDIQIVG